MVWALGGRACLLVPEDLWTRLDQEQQAALLLHELAHLRRKDHWVRVLELIATGVFWWHPALWLVRKELHRAEEACCDLWVTWALPKAKRTHASALVAAVEFLSETRATRLPAGASGMGQVEDLSKRIGMIMRSDTPKGLGRTGFMAAAIVAFVLLPWGVTGAQDQAKKATAELDRATAATAEARALIDLRDKIDVGSGDRAKRIRDAQDALQSAKGRLAVMEARTAKAEAQKKLAAATSARIQHLKAKNVTAVSREEDDRAVAELAIAEAGVAEAEAEQDEARLKVEQAARRLKDLEQDSDRATGADPFSQDQAKPPLDDKKSVEVKRAEAQLVLATAQFARLKRHYARAPGNVSVSELEKAQAEVEVAQKHLDALLVPNSAPDTFSAIVKEKNFDAVAKVRDTQKRADPLLQDKTKERLEDTRSPGVRIAEVQVRMAAAKLASAKKRVAQGLTSPAEVDVAEGELEITKAKLDAALNAGPTARDSQKRLDELESKLDRVLKELELMRKEKPAPKEGGATVPIGGNH
jgi:hypothetical protein